MTKISNSIIPIGSPMADDIDKQVDRSYIFVYDGVLATTMKMPTTKPLVFRYNFI